VSRKHSWASSGGERLGIEWPADDAELVAEGVAHDRPFENADRVAWNRLIRVTNLASFVRGLPKAELHLHIEGSLEPEQMFAFGKRNKVDIPFKSVEEVKAAYAFSNLQDFLDIIYQADNVLMTEEDFKDIALAYFARLHADGGRHAEIFFDPQAHTDRGLPFGRGYRSPAPSVSCPMSSGSHGAATSDPTDRP